MRLTEIRLLASFLKVASVHIEKPAEGFSGPTDIVLSYRNRKRIETLAEREKPRLRIVDDKSAYFRLTVKEMGPEKLYGVLKRLLRAE